MKTNKQFLLSLLLIITLLFAHRAKAQCNIQMILSYNYLGGSEYIVTSYITGAARPSYLWLENGRVPTQSYGNNYSTITLVLPPGTSSEVQLAVMDSATGCIGVDSVSITAPNCSFFAYAGSTPLGSSMDILSIQVMNGGTPPYTYYWSGGRTTPTDTVSFSSIYSVVVTDAAGCQAFTGDTVTNLRACVDSAIIEQFTDGAGKDSLVCRVISILPDGSSFGWSTGSNNSFITVTNNGIYSATIYNFQGCEYRLFDTVSNLPCSISDQIVAQELQDGNTLFIAVTSGVTHPGYVWHLPDGSLISGHDTIILPPFALFPPLIVTIIDSGTQCSFTDSIYSIDRQVASLRNIQNDVKVSLAPNPFHDRTIITVGGVDVDDISMELYDINGQRLEYISPISRGIFIVSGNGLIPGIYIYAIRQKDVMLTRGKLVLD